MGYVGVTRTKKLAGWTMKRASTWRTKRARLVLIAFVDSLFCVAVGRGLDRDGTRVLDVKKHELGM